MPPKKLITMDQIIDKAYEMVRKNGCESLTARNLAKELNCSTQPIYQAFVDMNDLKSSLVKRASERLMQYIIDNRNKDQSPILSKVLGYVQFANEEKYLFQLMFSSGSMQSEEQRALVPVNNELELNMIVYAHGIVMMNAFGTLDLPWSSIHEMIVNAYHCFESK